MSNISLRLQWKPQQFINHKNLIDQLINTGIKPGTLIWDRGNVSKEHVDMIESAHWKLICGIPKTLKDVTNIIDKTEIPLSPETFVRELLHAKAVKLPTSLNTYRILRWA